MVSFVLGGCFINKIGFDTGKMRLLKIDGDYL